MTAPFTRTAPFIKWAGGKGRQAETLAKLFPKKFKRYFEPMVGGGAIFWHLHNEGRLKGGATLNDSLRPLIHAYRAVRGYSGALKLGLRKLAHQYDRDAEGTYRKAVKRFNAYVSAQPRVEGLDIDIATLFLFLNKTCFNGLFRVNRKGEFNVPIGRYENPTILDPERIEACSMALQNVLIECKDYEKVVSRARKGDFVYFDPPYWPLQKGGFTSYTADKFNDVEQLRLAAVCQTLREDGVHVAISNHDLPEVRQAYPGWYFSKTKATRSINSDGAKRGHVGELLIRSYPLKDK